MHANKTDHKVLITPILQGKLIGLFSKQLVAKGKLSKDEIPPELREFPKTKQWLKIVGVDEDVIEVCTLQILIVSFQDHLVWPKMPLQEGLPLIRDSYFMASHLCIVPCFRGSVCEM